MFNDPLMTMAVINAADNNPHNDHLATTLAMTSMMSNPNHDPTTSLLMMSAMNNQSGDNGQLARNMLMVNSLNQMEQQRAEEERQRRAEEQRQRQIEAEHRRQLEAERQRQEEERRRLEAIQRQNAFNAHMDEGMGFANTKQYAPALEQFNQALSIYPKDFEANANKAICLKNLEEYKQAYDLFLSLAGQSNKMPGFEQHLEFCEDRLLEICSEHLEFAKNAYAAGNKVEAKKVFNEIVSLAPNRTTAGKQLSKQSNNYIRQIAWDGVRGQTIENFNEGLAFLSPEQQKFEQALRRFEGCSKTFQEFSSFLNANEQAMAADLPRLIKQANRGLEWLKNIHLQAEINTALGKLSAKVKNFEIADAVQLCINIRSKCQEITDPKDISPEEYISLELISESIEQLMIYEKGLKQRVRQFNDKLRTDIDARIKAADMLLNESDMANIHESLTDVIQTNWSNLDSRDLTNITMLLSDAILPHCKAHNVFGACCAGVSHYLDIDNSAELRILLSSIVQANIPVDTRRPIQLEILRPASAPKLPLGFSQGYMDMTGAGAPAQAEIVRAVEVMPGFDLNKDPQEDAKLPTAQLVM